MENTRIVADTVTVDDATAKVDELDGSDVDDEVELRDLDDEIEE